MNEFSGPLYDFFRLLNEFTGAITFLLFICVITALVFLPSILKKWKISLPSLIKRIKVLSTFAQIVEFFTGNKANMRIASTDLHQEEYPASLNTLLRWVNVKKAVEFSFAGLDLTMPWKKENEKSSNVILASIVKLLNDSLHEDIISLNSASGIFSNRTSRLIEQIGAVYNEYIGLLIREYQNYSDLLTEKRNDYMNSCSKIEANDADIYRIATEEYNAEKYSEKDRKNYLRVKAEFAIDAMQQNDAVRQELGR